VNHIQVAIGHDLSKPHYIPAGFVYQ